MKQLSNFLFLLFLAGKSLAQQPLSGELHGNTQTDIQYYRNDSAIGAPKVPEKFRMNHFTNLIFEKGNFSAGIRYEAYYNALLGFDQRYNGNGIPFRYAHYKNEQWEFTAGNFYEQFGSGLILRSYEERGLGYDNCFDGARVKFIGIKGIEVKGLVGKQRVFFEKGPGIVRGFDAEINLNEILPSRKDKTNNLVLGGSFVSKYQQDQNSTFRLPENVGAYSGRTRFVSKNLSLSGEYVYKINDPSTVNNYIYKTGEALLINAAYTVKGFGFNLGVKRIDNMNFRSDREAQLNNLLINFLPALTRQHTYNLAATLYPYATQPNGETGLQADVITTFKKGSFLGGKYGTTLLINYSNAYGLVKEKYTGADSLEGYKSHYFRLPREIYYQDLNIEVNKKLSKKIKMVVMYASFVFNGSVITGVTQKSEIVHAHIGVVDLTYKISSTHALRTEFQLLYTQQDRGNWAAFLAEYTVAPKWFFAFLNQYNFGNPDPSKRLNYPILNIGYIKEATRVTIGYGRQRAGIFCVGGVCRQVPASNGLSVSVTTSF